MHKSIMALMLVVSSVFAYGQGNCQHVGGSISTNFLDPATTYGSATGDMAGGVGVAVMSIIQGPGGTLTLHNQHHWVTVFGDTIKADAADMTLIPSGLPGLYAASYQHGVPIVGGTGKFLNASGKISAWGAVDTVKNQVVLRYEGTVCFARED